ANGLHAEPGDAASLADAVVDLLSTDGLAETLRREALREVRARYAWKSIADQTAGVYEEVLQEYERSRWDAAVARRRSEEEAAWNALARLVGRGAGFGTGPGRGFSRYTSTARDGDVDATGIAPADLPDSAEPAYSPQSTELAR